MGSPERCPSWVEPKGGSHGGSPRWDLQRGSRNGESQVVIPQGGPPMAFPQAVTPRGVPQWGSLRLVPQGVFPKVDATRWSHKGGQWGTLMGPPMLVEQGGPLGFPDRGSPKGPPKCGPPMAGPAMGSRTVLPQGIFSMLFPPSGVPEGWCHNGGPSCAVHQGESLNGCLAKGCFTRGIHQGSLLWEATKRGITRGVPEAWSNKW